ncbi:adenylate/guanylate cyclase domain-containing protein [Thermus brockianus]|uniref:Adenylate cyclase n=1 Tax=Thermus brockianus TaxID=56956 RepID=A0ABN6NHI5_THEBO|nr:adenylate/guanylate cyclase domain-containing protein [Thermus brockianus]BDG16886.1 adenylate cyclase [Thermus brockianus]
MRCECGHKNPPEARFCMACGQALGVILPEERRFVSVVFFDLVDSTRGFREGLASAYARLQEALEGAARAARCHGGFVHRFLGDGILVLFGAPRSKGLEPWRALEAALGMVQASPLPARAGVASGEVLWAPLGSGQAGEPTAVGSPVVLAERLSKLATPGEVLADATTLALAKGAQADFLGYREARGLGEVPVYRVRRVEIALDPEEEALLQEVRRALARPPARLNLVGPPGSGKSLLLEKFLVSPPFPTALLERMGPETPLRASLRQAVERTLGDPDALLAKAKLPAPLALAFRYSLGLEGRPPWPREDLEGAILEAWKRFLAGLGKPLLIVLKDHHTPDRTLERFLQEELPENVLLLVESRLPLFAPSLALKGSKAPPLLALQPALDALPPGERRALLAYGVLGEAPEALVKKLAGPFSKERLLREGLLAGESPLPEVREAALALVPEATAKAWHGEAARFHLEAQNLRQAAFHLARAGRGLEAAQILRSLAQAAWHQGHPEKALPLYQEALAIAPSSWQAFLTQEVQDAQASLGQGPEAEAGPRRQDPALRAFRQVQNPLDLLPLLPGLKPYPQEEAQARLLLAGALWRRFQPQRALEVLSPFHPALPPSLHLHRQSLRAGLLMDLGRYREAEALLAEGAEGDREAQVRFRVTRLRLLLETGRLPQALAEGEAHYGETPHPWLAAALLTAWTLRGRFREDLFQEALKHPDGRGLAALALAHHRWQKGLDPVPLLKEALREARRLANPYVHHLTLTSLALYLWPLAPKKAQALSQHLLYQTHRTGFAVHHEVARLLRAQLLLEGGEPVEHLLGFTPSVPFTQAWHAALSGEPPGRGLRGYGILGRWVQRLWAERGKVWTRRKR